MSRKNLVKGWRLKGQALLAQGHGERAEASLSQALTTARQVGNPPQLWKTYQALGALYEWQADLERARGALFAVPTCSWSCMSMAAFDGRSGWCGTRRAAILM
ncbi:MAG TPA: hypothetical protein VI542_39345, partial [Candidatus Tectomicrobia bacterium]